MMYKSLSMKLWVAFFLVISVCAIAQIDSKPKNIILLIGDGMGNAHITAAKLVKNIKNFDRFKIMGMSMTRSTDNAVTDSAAGGTALASGVRTKNGAVGVTPEGEPVRNVMEHAQDAGKATGVVVTSTFCHATPAAFAAHCISRHHYDDISEQMVNSKLDVIIGGGFDSLSHKTFTGSRRKDDKDMMRELRRSRPVITTYGGLGLIGKTEKLAAILSGGHLKPASQRKYSLGDLSAKAIEILSDNPKGFVLMIEGSQIDLASHANETERILCEVADFDKAIGVALDFAEKDKNTLVIVTSDHETGGMTLTEGSFEDENLGNVHFSTNKHTAGMVPIFAYGPGAEHFGGVRKNSEIGVRLINMVVHLMQ